MEKDAAGYPSLPLHYGLMNPGTSRTSPAAYPTSRAVLRGGGGGDVTSLPDAGVGDHPGLPGLKLYERVMAGRRRKTLVLCRKCHADVHAGRRDGATTEEGSDWKAG